MPGEDVRLDIQRRPSWSREDATILFLQPLSEVEARDNNLDKLFPSPVVLRTHCFGHFLPNTIMACPWAFSVW